MEIYQAIILGVLQGLTEFLPVSSSGHLVLGQLYFGITESALAFDISVHMGTLAAVLVVYFSDIRAMLAAVFACIGRVFSGKPADIRGDKHLVFILMILVGSVPTALIGLFLKQFEHVLFASSLLVGCMLITTGFILWTSRRFFQTDTAASPLDVKRAVLIGVGQGLAVMPGISRSGTTIAFGMFAGLDRTTAAKFSFLMSVPAIVGAELLSLRESFAMGQHIDSAMIWGTLAAFITGLAALKLLLKLVHTGKFHIFAPYCWLAGILALLSNLL